MKTFPPTFILRHRKENLSKCSLRGLEKRKDLCFFTYPWKKPIPPLDKAIVLSINAPLLTEKDANLNLFLIDGTWRYAEKMLASLPQPLEKRSLPKVRTAYPRKQTGCEDPKRGLASLEALYLAYLITGRNPDGLLDFYYFKKDFLKYLNDSHYIF